MNTKIILTALWICVAAAFAGTCANAQTVEDCTACHQDTTLVKTLPSGEIKALFVDQKAYMQSVHGEAGFSCVDCHEDAQPDSHPEGGLMQVKCQDCHDDIAEEQAKSSHGQLLKQEGSGAPACYDCHSTHAVLRSDNPESTVHADNLRITCAKCHKNEAAPVICEAARDFAAGDPEAAERISIPSTLAMLATRLKGHGKTDFGCTYNTKQCSNCHIDVTQHSGSTEPAPICAKCHDMQRSTLLFGKIHKPTIFTGPILILLLVMWVICIGGLILYFKKTAQGTKKTSEETPAEE